MFRVSEYRLNGSLNWVDGFRVDTLLTALTKRTEVQNLTGVSNNCGTVESGLGAYSV